MFENIVKQIGWDFRSICQKTKKEQQSLTHDLQGMIY